MPRGTHTFDFKRYEGKTIYDVTYSYFASYETLTIRFSDGDILEIYSEDLCFEHATHKEEDS